MDPTIKAFIFSLILLLIAAIVGFGFARLGRARDKKSDLELRALEEAKEEVAKRNEEIDELKRQMAVLTAASVPIQAAFQAMLVAKLTHFHTPVVDALMAKLGPPNVITPAERKELDLALKERMVDLDGRIDDEEKIAAKILLDCVELTRINELRHQEASTEVVLVSQPLQPEMAPEEETE